MSDNEGESSQNQFNIKDFTPNEQHEIEYLRNAMQSRGSSKIEKEIAEAKLDVILKSKEKPPHNRRHRIPSLETEGSGSSNIFNDDITFEKYEMGNDGKKEKGSKARNDDVASVKFNHKARGAAKEKIENEAGKDQMDNIHF